MTLKADEQILVSVILTTYNRRHLLPNAIESVLSQTYQNFEIIIVNDYGEDVWDIIQKYQKENIQYLNNLQNYGPAYSRNIAVSAAKGEIVCYLDDDDRFLSEHLETVVHTMVKERVNVVYTDAFFIEEKQEGIKEDSTDKFFSCTNTDFSKDRLLVFNYIPVNTLAHKYDALPQVHGFDETLESHEDWEFFLKLSQLYDFVHIHKQTVEIYIRTWKRENRTYQEKNTFFDVYRKIYRMYPSKNLSVTKERYRRLYHLGKFSRNPWHAITRFIYAFLFLGICLMERSCAKKY